MLAALKVWRIWAVFLLGIPSGLPLLLIGSTLKAWMKEVQVDLSVIGIFGLVGLPYTIKFLWAPFLDRYSIPLLDRRRGWIVIFQVMLALFLAGVAFVHPAEDKVLLASICFCIAFFSACQDIVIDAYRREILEEEELGLGSSLGINGYRIGMVLLGGAFALPLADQVGWHKTYLAMAAVMFLSIGLTVLSPKLLSQPGLLPKSMREVIINPFIEYFQRKGAWEILIFILLYKIGDSMASDMLTPFYLEIGFTKTEIGLVSKLFGFWATILGGLVGGFTILSLGIPRSLWIFGLLQALSTFGFSVLSLCGHSNSALAAVVAFENLTSGMGSAAYAGFMASLCNIRYTATQYALLTSLMGVPRVILGSSSGFLAKEMGWFAYFLFCTAIATPGILLLLRMPKWQNNPSARK